MVRARITTLHKTWYAYFLRLERDHKGFETPEKSVLSSIPAEGVSCSSETTQDRRMEPRIKVVCFEEEITETKNRTPKSCPGFDS
jgi:hypothetical protein